MQDNADKSLTPKQVAFIEALLLGNSIKGAGEAVGISLRTSRTWIKLPAIREELKRLQDESLARTLRLMNTLGPQAVNVLGRNMKPDAQPTIQVRAALGLLTQLVALSQYGDIEARLQALEQAAQVRTNDRGML